MTVSEISCEPNPDSPGFVRVFVDGRLLTEFAHPFQARDSVITLFGDPDYPEWKPEDEGWAAVRGLEDYVVWFDSYVWAGYPPESFGVIAFQYEQYVLALGKEPPRLRLPELTPEEFRSTLYCSFPREELPIYTSPQLRDDPRGTSLIKRVQRFLFDELPDRIVITEPPVDWLEIRIGLDMEGFPECVWRVGKTRNGMAVWFVSRPTFPLWLCGEPVDRAFGPVLRD